MPPAEPRQATTLPFDRAASFYDQTRALSPATEAAVTVLLATELAGRGTVLEVGVGTGRIALPLVRAGLPIVGVDLSVPMLEAMRAKHQPGEVLPIGVADATRLPVGGATVGAAFTCHVLHLVPDWSAAVAEMIRVVRPGGLVLVDLGGHPGATDAIHRRFAGAAGLARTRVGIDVDEGPLLDQVMGGHGASLRLLPTVTERRSLTPGEVVDRIEANQFSWTWDLDDDCRRQAAAATRTWAAHEYGSLDAPLDIVVQITWRAYDLA